MLVNSRCKADVFDGGRDILREIPYAAKKRRPGLSKTEAARIRSVQIYLHVHAVPDWLTYLTAGVGAGIGLALAGSVIHDAFAGQPRR